MVEVVLLTVRNGELPVGLGVSFSSSSARKDFLNLEGSFGKEDLPGPNIGFDDAKRLLGGAGDVRTVPDPESCGSMISAGLIYDEVVFSLPSSSATSSMITLRVLFAGT